MNTKATVGFAMCGSFCTFGEIIPQIQALVDEGYNIIPIMSYNAYSLDTRFGKAQDFIQRVESIANNTIIHTIDGAEPIGPKSLLDLLVIAPCTGNTASKIALGITDTPVTMAAKAHLRNEKPLLISIATNDALGMSAKNIGALHSIKNFYFVPYRQDNAVTKPSSMVADAKLIPKAVAAALEGKQLQPVII